jgi:c-di-GMP-binding flagellar brake protein YcgR
MTDADQNRDDPPVTFELMQADYYSKYLLHSRAEIGHILRTLKQKGSLITVYFNQGNDFFLTTVLGADDNHLIVDVGADAATNRKALASDKLIFITTLDKVKVQFSVGRIEETRHETRPALRCTLPDSLLRLQRREYYRLSTPVATPIKCLIPVPVEERGKRAVETTVVDISGGGVAVVVPPQGVPFAPEMRFDDCRIELPDTGVITASLEVRNLFDVTLRNGARVKRAGCQFHSLSGTMATMIQRYILRVERERKARESGMG